MFTRYELFTHVIAIITKLGKPATSSEIMEELKKIDIFKNLTIQSLNGTLSHSNYSDILTRIPNGNKGKTTYKVNTNYSNSKAFKSLDGYVAQEKN